jgi:DNA (cytosine-5)-methyltransferase 1
VADGSFQRPLDFGHELVVDLFAGGGGASLGIARAYRNPDIAVNHSPIAIAVHAANHPDTEHFTCDVFEVDPVVATRGRPVGLLWASPDCRHHSKAKGGKPRNKKIRALAWVVVKWAAAVRPRVIHLENVEEFADWGPLQADDQPCPERKGLTFRRWVRQLERLGYAVEWRELRGADYGAPTIRKRLYVTARCDGRAITWPKPSHHRTGAGGLPRWRTAGEDCIDWTLVGRSIFDRPRPLALNTQLRIAKGLWRYVLDTPTPYIVPLRGTSAAHHSAHGIDQPLSTITGGGTHHGLVEPVLASFVTDQSRSMSGKVAGADEPLRTQCAQVKGGHFALVSGYLVPRYGERAGQEPRALRIDAPMPTVVPTGNGGSLACAYLAQASGGPNGHVSIGHDARSPLSTITGTGSHQQVVNAYLVKFYSCGGQWQGCGEPLHTVPTKDRMGLVQVVHVPADILAPELMERARACAAFLHQHLPEHFPEPADLVLVGDHVLVDITLRMLTPRELARAQGLPEDYQLEVRVLKPRKKGPPVWRVTSKADQVRLIGNCVLPDVAEALVGESLAGLIDLYARAA